MSGVGEWKQSVEKMNLPRQRNDSNDRPLSGEI